MVLVAFAGIPCGCGGSSGPSPHYTASAVRRCLRAEGIASRFPKPYQREPGSEGGLYVTSPTYFVTMIFSADEGDARHVRDDTVETFELEPFTPHPDDTIRRKANVTFYVTGESFPKPALHAINSCLPESLSG